MSGRNVGLPVLYLLLPGTWNVEHWNSLLLERLFSAGEQFEGVGVEDGDLPALYFYQAFTCHLRHDPSTMSPVLCREGLQAGLSICRGTHGPILRAWQGTRDTLPIAEGLP